MNNSLEELKQILDFNVLSTRGEVKLAPDDIDWEQCRKVWVEGSEGAEGYWSDVKAHAKVGVRALLANPYFFIADEMGGMKTAQTIIAAQLLFLAGVIDRVIVLTPNDVKSVWYDKEIGELSLHLFKDLPNRVSEFHSKIRQWDHGDWKSRPTQLRWIVTNYEFIARSKERQKQLKAYCGPRTLLVSDESSAIKNKTTAAAKATLLLRRLCGRVVLLNGTPIADTIMDLMNQCNLMHPSILECPYITMFRDRYCELLQGVDYPQVIGYKNVADIQKRLAPFVLRRLKEQCLDLPPELPSIASPVNLTDPTWKHYKSQRDDMVTWVGSNLASISGQAITKAMRLAQITSGFIGGVEEVFEETDDELPTFMQSEEWFLNPEVPVAPRAAKAPFNPLHFIGREKLDALLAFYAGHLEEDPAFKLLARFRFREELHRFMHEFNTRWPHIRHAMIEGGQKKADRTFALRLLHPRTCVKDQPAMLGATYGTGSMGHNFTGAHVAVNCSWDYSLFKFQQSNARIHRPGQTKAVSRFDLVAHGPAGQKTIDHTILKARKSKEDMAVWTGKAWLDELRTDG